MGAGARGNGRNIYICINDNDNNNNNNELCPREILGAGRYAVGTVCISRQLETLRTLTCMFQMQFFALYEVSCISPIHYQTMRLRAKWCMQATRRLFWDQVGSDGLFGWETHHPSHHTSKPGHQNNTAVATRKNGSTSA